jgi:DNA/RNA-binding domain of Phe-tRNA-synthetase-like protein
MLKISASWLEDFDQYRIGILGLENLINPASHPALEEAADKSAALLREQYRALSRQALRQLPVFAAYHAFYRNFRKSYHVRLQLESVVFSKKPIQSASSLVTAMFLSELETGLLTAVHDWDLLKEPLRANTAAGDESFQQISGQNKILKKGDLYLADQSGIISSVMYGPDFRTRIRPDTARAIFTTYGMPGISRKMIETQLLRLEDLVRLFSPDLGCAALQIFP